MKNEKTKKTMKIDAIRFLSILGSASAFSSTPFLKPQTRLLSTNQPPNDSSANPANDVSTNEDYMEFLTIPKARDAEILAPPSAPSASSTLLFSKNPPRVLGEAYKHGVFSPEPKLITLDATDTLIQLSASVGLFYRETLFEATDYNARLPRPEIFTDAFGEAFAEADAANPCFGCGTGLTSKEWWRGVVKKTYDLVFADPVVTQPGLLEAMDEWLFEELFEALYSDVFVTDEAWELRPGALEALSHLVAWRDEGGPALAIMSNFDERLYSILKNLEILDAFDFVLTSREIGAAKPDRRAFEVAMSKIGITDPRECVHVGNSFRRDVLGAWEAGWHGVYIPKTGEQIIPQNDAGADLQFTMVGDLFGVLNMYGREPMKRIIQSTRHITEEGNFAFDRKRWDDEIEEDIELSTPYTGSQEQKAWEGPGRF